MTQEENSEYRNTINLLHRKLREDGESFRIGYYKNSIPSILNAFREADISFDEAVKLIEKIIEDKIKSLEKK